MEVWKTIKNAKTATLNATLWAVEYVSPTSLEMKTDKHFKDITKSFVASAQDKADRA